MRDSKKRARSLQETIPGSALQGLPAFRPRLRGSRGKGRQEASRSACGRAPSEARGAAPGQEARGPRATPTPAPGGRGRPHAPAPGSSPSQQAAGVRPRSPPLPARFPDRSPPGPAGASEPRASRHRCLRSTAPAPGSGDLCTPRRWQPASATHPSTKGRESGTAAHTEKAPAPAALQLPNRRLCACGAAIAERPSLPPFKRPANGGAEPRASAWSRLPRGPPGRPRRGGEGGTRACANPYVRAHYSSQLPGWALRCAAVLPAVPQLCSVTDRETRSRKGGYWPRALATPLILSPIRKMPRHVYPFVHRLYSSFGAVILYLVSHGPQEGSSSHTGESDRGTLCLRRASTSRTCPRFTCYK